MLNRTRFWCAAAALAGLALVLGGCSSESFTSPGDEQSRAGLEESAPTTLAGLPVSDGVEILAEELLGVIEGTFAASSRGPAGAAPRVPACSPTFDVGNGITGTCSVSDTGTVTITFAGTRTIDGVATTIQGTLTAAETTDQPVSGKRYTVTLAATAESSRGVAAWYMTGTAVVSDAGQLTDFTLSLSLTMTPTGGSPRAVTITLTPTVKTVFCQTANGLNVSYILNRSTMTGVVSVQGRQFATVTFSGDCVTFHFVNAVFPDATICRV